MENENRQQNISGNDEISLFDYINVLIKRRYMILLSTIITALATAIISLILPKYYTAATTLLPPEEGDKTGLAGMLSNAPSAFLDMAGVSGNSSDIFVEILNSRTVAEAVISQKYRIKGEEKTLMEIFETKLKVDAIKKLHTHSHISSNEQGIVTISVELKDPVMAADVAKAYVKELHNVNQNKSLSRAKSSRLYIEEQLKLTEKNLKKASRGLAEFQEKYNAVDLQQQTKVGIEKAGEIKGTIMAKEVQFEVARQTMKQDNPIVVHLQKELDELQKQFKHLQFGDSDSVTAQKDYFIPFSDVPELGLRYSDLAREIKVQETVWQLLNQQYFSAKIQEARDTPTVQVLDEAAPPERRSSPKRGILVLVAAFLMFAVSTFAAFALEFTEKLKENEESFHKAKEIADEIKQDYQTTRRWLNKRFNRLES